MLQYDYYLIHSYKEALHSPDPSTQTGAVLVREGSNHGLTIGRGFNHFPQGVDPAFWHIREQKYLRVVHAEVAAILDAAKKGESTEDTTLVAGWAACSNCAKYIVAAGVRRLVRHEFLMNGVDKDSPWFEDCQIGDEIMRDAGVDILEVPPVPTDIQLRRNGQLWSPA